jgi:hypothetical protein
MPLRDLTNPRVIRLKGVLFLLGGLLASLLLWLDTRHRSGPLLCWPFQRGALPAFITSRFM